MKIQLPDFADKREMFAYLVQNKAALVELKKTADKRTDEVFMLRGDGAGVMKLHSDGSRDTADVIHRTIVGNTYYWMDSHDDVHLEGLFAKSIADRKGKINHFHDHLMQLVARVGVPENIYEKWVDWTELGVAVTGQTQVLLMDSAIKRDMNSSIFNGYLAGEINQHSVGMRYVQMALAVNDPEYKEEYAEWLKYIDRIGNRAKAEERGYFWPIKEAKLIEISCVVEGSNELTQTAPVKSTQQEPQHSTQEEPPFDLDLAIRTTKFII